MAKTTAFTALEKRAVSSLSLLYMIRMLGLFMVLPVLSVLGTDYEGATPQLLGLAVGAYGCTQALLQIPFGWLSDRWGRKPVILFGLAVFALGSGIAALADNVWWLIVGRALQGAGAIAAAIMALVADLTRDVSRTKAMASIGASIGVAFALAMVLGPVISSIAGLSGIFSFTLALSLLAMLLVVFRVPTPSAATATAAKGDTQAMPKLMGKILRHSELRRLNVGVLFLHAMLTALFVGVPAQMLAVMNLPVEQHGYVYLPVMLLAFVIMLPGVIIAEKRRKIKPVFLLAILLLLVAQGLFGALGHLTVGLVLGLLVFFVGFNLLEATLPSLVSKIAPAGTRGTASGCFSTCQFAGGFLGGILGGSAVAWGGFDAVLGLNVLLGVLWLSIAFFMAPPKHLTSVVASMDEQTFNDSKQQLKAINGVHEVNYVAEEDRVYLKVDSQAFSWESLAPYGVKTA